MTERLTEDEIRGLQLLTTLDVAKSAKLDMGVLARLLSEVTDLREEVEDLKEARVRHATSWLNAITEAGEAELRAARAESLLSEIRHIVEAERQAFGRSAFTDALWETLNADDDATAPAEAAGAIQGRGAVSGEEEASTSDTQTFSRPMMWVGLGKD